MLKRKYGARDGWKRLIKKKVNIRYIDEEKSYASYIKMENVLEPLFVQYGEDTICIVDNGYEWIQYIPLHRHYSITMMFNQEQTIIQWYIDITKENGFHPVKGPWMDDLYLDLIVLPSGKIIEKDRKELENAFTQGIITREDYDLAIFEGNCIARSIEKNELDLVLITSKLLKLFNSGED
ncbi:DUF402 domain-containing protein [Rossellomorea aquimaris]|uniref:DUF402 domain-containing protein n=1 Tax=Rossellomorea aquimaris TaxID=189382 RepID=UPI0007D05BDA|nr:DUF402 domain-containing protein [Rossellomorea aquimaris]